MNLGLSEHSYCGRYAREDVCGEPRLQAAMFAKAHRSESDGTKRVRKEFGFYPQPLQIKAGSVTVESCSRIA